MTRQLYGAGQVVLAWLMLCGLIMRAGAQTPPEMILQRGHDGAVNALSFARMGDRPLAVSASDDGTVRLWDIRCQLLMRVLRGEGGPLYALAATTTTGGDPLIVAGGGATICVWNGRTGQRIRTITVPLADRSLQGVRALALAPGGGLVAAATDESEDVVLEGKPAPRHNVFVWSLATGQPVAAWLAHPHGVNALAWSLDGKTLWTAGGTHFTAARLGRETAPLAGWNPRTGTKTQTFAAPGGHTNTVMALSLSPDGKTLASGGADKAVRLWSAKTGTLTQTLTPTGYEITALAWARGGTRLAGGGASESDVWEIPGGQNTRPSAQRSTRPALGKTLAASPDGAMVAGASGGDITISDGTNLGEDAQTLASFPGVEARAQTLDLDPTGRWAVTLSAASGTRTNGASRYTRRSLDIWDGRNGALQVALSQAEVGQVNTVRFAPHESLLAVGSDGGLMSKPGERGTIYLLDPQTGKRQAAFAPTAHVANALAWSPDGKTLVSGGGDFLDKPPFSLYWWGREGGAPRHEVKRNRPADALAVSPDGKTLAAGDRVSQQVYLYDMETGAARGALAAADPGGSVRSLAFSPDGAYLAYGGYERSEYPVANVRKGRTLLIWDIKSGKPRPLLPAPAGEVDAVVWSRDGRYLFAGDASGKVTVWNLQTGKRVSGWQAETDAQGVAALALAPGGDRLFSVSAGGQVRLWRLRGATPAPLLSLFALDTAGYFAVTPDNYYRVARQASSVVGFRVGGQVFPFDAFDAVYNRPDRVLAQVGGDPAQIAAFAKAFAKRQARNGARPLVAGWRVRADAVPLYSKSALITFPVAVEGQAMRPAQRLRVWVNATPIPDVALDAAGRASVTVTLAPPSGAAKGKNRIDIAAVGADGAASLPQTLYVFYDGDDPAKRNYLGDNHLIYSLPPVPHDLYLLCVGVTNYANPAYNLRYAARDAQAVSTYWGGGAGHFSATHIQTLTDADATAAHIKAVARDLLRGAKPGDTVILFFAGHGLLAPNGDYFYGTHDISFNHPQGTGLSYGEMEHLLDGCAARNRLLLMDTCHAGEVDPALFRRIDPPKSAAATATATVKSDAATVTATALPEGARRGMSGNAPPGERGANTEQEAFALMQEAFADLRRGSGLQVIAASGGTEYAYEEKGSGVFTAALLEGLAWDGGRRRADANHDGMVSVSELRDWVVARVLTLTRGQQKPVVRAESAEFDFPVF